jgi:hypothetical protein
MEEQFLCPFPGRTTDRMTHPVHFVIISRVHVLIHNNFRLYDISHSSQKLPSVGGACMLVSVCTSHLSFQTNVVMSPLTLTCMSHFFIPTLLLHKSCGKPFWLGRTAQQQLIFFVISSSNKCGNEKKLSFSGDHRDRDDGLGFKYEVPSQGLTGLTPTREVFTEEVSGPHTCEDDWFDLLQQQHYTILHWFTVYN